MDLQTMQDLIDSKSLDNPDPSASDAKRFEGFWDTSNEEYGKFYDWRKEQGQKTPPPDLDDTLKQLGLEGYTGSSSFRADNNNGGLSGSDPLGGSDTDAQRQQLKSSYAERYMKNECSTFWRNLKELKDEEGGDEQQDSGAGADTLISPDVLAILEQQTGSGDANDDVYIHTVPSSASSMRSAPNYYDD